MIKVGERIKQLRIEEGMNQRELATRINYTQSLIAKWENGMRLPSLEAVLEMAKIFGVTIDFLIGLTDY